MNSHGRLGPNGTPLFYDFSAFYQAAGFADAGHAARAYDDGAMLAAEQAAFPGATLRLPWNYPPTFQLILAPLGALPYVAAWLVWSSALYGFYALLARQIAVAGQRWLVLLAPGAAVNLLVGQNGLLSTILMGGGVMLLRSRPIVAGGLLGLMTYKPHFAVLVPLVLICGREWRALGAAVVSGAGLALLALAVFGVDPWFAFVHKAIEPSSIFSSSSSDWRSIPSVMIMARTLGASAGLGAALHWSVAAAAAFGTFWVWRKTDDGLLRAAALATATLLVTPYLQDLRSGPADPADRRPAAQGRRRGQHLRHGGHLRRVAAAGGAALRPFGHPVWAGHQRGPDGLDPVACRPEASGPPRPRPAGPVGLGLVLSSLAKSARGPGESARFNSSVRAAGAAMTTTMSDAAWVLLAAAVLLLPAILWGRPFVFGDTLYYDGWGGDVLDALQRPWPHPGQPWVTGRSLHGWGFGLHDATPADLRFNLTWLTARSAFYAAPFHVLLRLGGLWLIAGLQALAAAWVVRVAIRSLAPASTGLIYIGVIASLTAASSLGFVTDYAMPDIFGGLAILAAVTLIVCPERLGRAERLGLVALVVYAVLAHAENGLNVAAAFILGFLWFWRSGVGWRAALGRAGADRLALAIGLALAAGGGIVLKAAFGQPVRMAPFAASRMFADGVAQPYLSRPARAPIWPPATWPIARPSRSSTTCGSIRWRGPPAAHRRSRRLHPGPVRPVCSCGMSPTPKPNTASALSPNRAAWSWAACEPTPCNSHDRPSPARWSGSSISASVATSTVPA